MYSNNSLTNLKLLTAKIIISYVYGRIIQNIYVLVEYREKLKRSLNTIYSLQELMKLIIIINKELN